jgi:hypothetical protein
MTVGSDKGKKIDEIQVLDWNSPKLVVRYHSSRYAPTFTVEAGDRSFKGENIRGLIEQGTVYLKGWSDLTWEPTIVVNTEIYSELTFQYSRCFKSRHKGADVFRSWKIGDYNEGTFGNRYRDEDKEKTGDRLDGGEPGEVMTSRERGRILPYTPDLWTQFRRLSEMLREANEKASEKLSELLKKKELPAILQTMTSLQPLGLQFMGEKK